MRFLRVFLAAFLQEEPKSRILFKFAREKITKNIHAYIPPFFAQKRLKTASLLDSLLFFYQSSQFQTAASPPLFTLHSSLFTLHFSLFTLHSSLFTLHFSLPHKRIRIYFAFPKAAKSPQAEPRKKCHRHF